MTEPLVVAICLTSDRQEMTQRAERCFLSQTYRNSKLLILDNGRTHYEPREGLYPRRLYYQTEKKTIGALRNEACELAIRNGADVIIHWDSDDWSRSDRIADQVGKLIENGSDICGYGQVMFWDVVRHEAWFYMAQRRNYVVSASMCFWAHVWQAQAFPDINLGEAALFAGGRNVAVATCGGRLICGIHGDNTNDYDAGRKPGTHGYTRVPEWDADVSKLMEDECQKKQQVILGEL